MDDQEIEAAYRRFCSLVHFLDVSQVAEIKEAHVEFSDAFVRELEMRAPFEIEELAELLGEYPEGIDAIEQILQLSNFTVAQRTYLMFDVKKLNSNDIDEALEYISAIFRESGDVRSAFERGKVVSGEQFPNIRTLSYEEKVKLLAESKTVIATVCRKPRKGLIAARISESESVRERVAEYLLGNRHFNEVLAGIRPREYLRYKFRPVDSKTAHGGYASRIVERVLQASGFAFLGSGDVLENRTVRRTPEAQRTLGDYHEFGYYTEAYVESLAGSNSRISSESLSSDRKTAKRFDFVLVYNGLPRVVIETNFYTTSGSKIGINEKEYVELRRIVEQRENLRFIWITDGSYWLTTTGRRSFFKLAPEFGEDLMNIGLFAVSLDEIKARMKEQSK